VKRLKRVARPVSPQRLHRCYQSLQDNYHSDASVVGRIAAARLAASEINPRVIASVRLAGYASQLYFRPGTSDVAVIRQVFVREEYRSVVGLDNVRLIIDCGANIGCTSYYLLHCYPTAQV